MTTERFIIRTLVTDVLQWYKLTEEISFSDLKVFRVVSGRLG